MKRGIAVSGADRTFVLIILGCWGSVVSYASHESRGPEAALIPIIIGLLLAFLVHRNVFNMSYIKVSILVCAIELLAGLITQILFVAPFLT